MTDPVDLKKKELRRIMRARRRSLSDSEQADAARKLVGQLWSLPGIGDSRGLLATLPVGGELSVAPFLDEWLQRGRALFLPKVDEDLIGMTPLRVASMSDIRPGYRDCPEPDPVRCPAADISEIDVFLAPGVAFDRGGARLGQGGGHFDRMLAHRRIDSIVVGVAHFFQVIDDIPFRPEFDQRMDWIATPEGIVRCSGQE
ncbi:5-formyltetrahydrofolate cyclo-ligase [bacterium]|nr:5-formyltetrahydrofolate cyclo-ligase [bacterium]